MGSEKRKALNEASQSNLGGKNARLWHENNQSPASFADSDIDSPDEAVEALLGLHRDTGARPTLEDSEQAEQSYPSGPGSTTLRQGLRSSKRSRLTLRDKPRQISTKSAANVRTELPKRCSCGKHISKDHPLCKSNVKELLERFLDKYCRGAAKGSVVDLQQAEVEFDVALRRLYDILVVLEAAQVLLRVSSKKYEVLGLGDRDSLHSWLDKYGEQRTRSVKTGFKDDKVVGREQGGSYDLSCMLMIHLREQKRPVVLSEAAEVLKGMSPKAKACKKTIERRIYDIGSVLETLDLITRSYQPPNKQPSFQWNDSGSQALQTERTISEDRAALQSSDSDKGITSSFPMSPQLRRSLDQDQRPSVTSAFSNWSPPGGSECPGTPEDLLRRYSSDQMSDWSNQTPLRRPSPPPKHWPMSSGNGFTNGAEPQTSGDMSMPPPSSGKVSPQISAGELPSSMSILEQLASGLCMMPDRFASLSIPPLQLPSFSGSGHPLMTGLPQASSNRPSPPFNLCKPFATRAKSLSHEGPQQQHHHWTS